MDILQNPFYILNATMQDNRQRIIELAEECSLFQDVDKCTNARTTLTHPRNRLSAEIAWMPGTDPQHVNQLLKLLESPTRNLLNLTGLTPLAQTNLFVSGLLHIANSSKSNIIEWMLKISRTFEYINPAEVHAILNEERRKAGFSEIPDVSAVTEEIQNRRQYYRQTIKLVLEKLSAEERAETVTIAVESATNNGENRLPVLIEDTVASYEIGIQSFLEKEQRIIEALDEKIRAVADVEDSEIILISTVNQLIEAVKNWDTLAQPIQVSKKKRGEHHDPSFDLAWRARNLSIHLCNEYSKLDVALQLTIMLQEVFAEVPAIAERIGDDRKTLERRIRAAAERKQFEKKEGNIKALMERLRKAADAKNSDTILAPIVNQLIQAIKSWAAISQPTQLNESNYRVALPVRELILYLWNKHGKLDLALQLTNVLLEVFAGVPEIDERLHEDLETLDKIAEERARLMEEAKRQEEKWRREITYEAEIGILFKNKVRISPEGIEWQGDQWDFNSITQLRWGGTRHSINGIPTGTTYTIVFGNDFNYTSIELRNKTVYNNVIDRLWRAVGIRLLTEYLEGWREGKTYKFDSAVISDHGVELERKRFFSSNERVFCQWSELVIWNEPGTFCIGKNSERKLSVSLSYQYEDNIHVIEAAIRMLLERGVDRLSQLLVE